MIQKKYSVLNKVSSGQFIALTELINLHGGPAAMAKLLDEERYNVANWRDAGKIPLHKVGEVARKLEVSIYLLNFEDVAELNGVAPKWKEIVNAVGFSKRALAAIMEAESPRWP